MYKNIEEKIKNYIIKRKDKKYSLLDLAKIIDPKCTISYTDLENVIFSLEKEGTIYHNLENDLYYAFPKEDGYIQSTVKKNKIGEVFINDNCKGILTKEDSKEILDGDLIVAVKTNELKGRRPVYKLDKIIERTSLLPCEISKDNKSTKLIPQDKDFLDKIIIDINELDNYKDKEIINIKIKTNKENGYYLGEIITKDNIKDDYKDNTSKDDIYNLDTVVGNIEINSHKEGIITVNNKKYLIKQKDLYDVLNNDLVEITPSTIIHNGYIISKLERVLKRSKNVLIAEITESKTGQKVLTPINYNFKHNIMLQEKDKINYVTGDRFVLNIGKELTDGLYTYTSIKHIGHKDDVDINLKMIACENNIDIEFTPEELQEANSIPKIVTEIDKANRLDLTKKKVFTIDGVNTKDRDDAISIEPISNDHYLVGIHISDVTHYIKPGSILWNTIINRATSVYMANTVIAMLPHIISNGICSLNPNTERLTFSCMVEMDKNGNVYNFDFVDTVIKSNIAMNYDDVNDILEKDIVKEEYKPYVEDLKILNEISKSLEIIKDKRGALNFNDIDKDIEIKTDENDNPIEFITHSSKSAEKLIENFMLLAGKCYADYMILPTTLRVHEKPDEESIEEAIKTLNKLGIRTNSISNLNDSKLIYKVIKNIKDEDIKKTALRILLSSLKKARIDVNPELGHFALAENKQGRFTSPIRRAEDALGHIQLRKQRDNLYDVNNFEKEYDNDYKYLQRLSHHITEKQYNAEQAEKEAVILKMIDYVNNHLDEEYIVKVIYINEEGIYVKASNGVMGIIRPKDYQNGNILYCDKTMTYRKDDEIIKIGTLLKVNALKTDFDNKMIYFYIPKEKIYKK